MRSWACSCCQIVTHPTFVDLSTNHQEQRQQHWWSPSGTISSLPLPALFDASRGQLSNHGGTKQQNQRWRPRAMAAAPLRWVVRQVRCRQCAANATHCANAGSRQIHYLSRQVQSHQHIHRCPGSFHTQGAVRGHQPSSCLGYDG